MEVVVINIKLDIDLGNLWEMLSAVGTVGAVVVSLVLAFRESKSKINVSLGTDVYFNRYYTLVLAKTPLETFTIVEIGYSKQFKKDQIDFSKSGVEVLNEQDVQISHDYLPINFAKESIIKIPIPNSYTDELIDKKIRFYVKDIEDRVFKSNKILIKELDSNEPTIS